MNRSTRQLYVALLGAGCAMLLEQLTELAVILYPYNPAAPTWRLGALGLAMTRVTGIVFADLVLPLVMMEIGARRLLRAWAALHLLAAIGLAGVLAVSGLDFLQLRAAIKPESRVAFTITAARALGVGLVFCVICLWAALAGLLGTRTASQEASPRGDPFFASGAASSRQRVEKPVPPRR